MKRFIAIVAMFAGCAPLKEFRKIPEYNGSIISETSRANYASTNKNVFILADNRGTEIFDLVAPFYLFSLTKKANVYIIAKELAPVSVMKGFFVLPHYTFHQVDSMGLIPHAIIIPNFSATKDDQQDPWISNWIWDKYSDSTNILSVCAGSFTAAATGLYDGKLMTTHASEMAGNKHLYKHPKWVENVSFTKDSNLYSTAGVSNAAEGSLALIKDMFGEATMADMMQRINYRYDTLKISHQSRPVTPSNKSAFLRKVLLRRDKKVGVMLQDGMDEFILSAILDSYHRTIPASLKTYSISDKPVTTKFGLILYPTGEASELSSLDEMHVLAPGLLHNEETEILSNAEIVMYDPNDNRYIFDVCLERIGRLYGKKFQLAVKRLLDYN